jgi:hypothetical protein
LTGEPEEIVVVPLWRVLLPLVVLWGTLGLLAGAAGYHEATTVASPAAQPDGKRDD